MMIKKQFITDDVMVYLTEDCTLLGVGIYTFKSEIWRVSYNSEVQLVDVVEINTRLYLITVAKEYSVSLLNVYSGVAEWTVTFEGQILPELMVGENDTLIIPSQKSHLSVIYSINAQSGYKIWEFVMSGHGEVIGPIIASPYVYVGGADRMESNWIEGKLVFLIRVFCLDLSTGAIKWLSGDLYPYQVEQDSKSSDLQVYTQRKGREGVLIARNSTQQHLLNSVTGELLWTFDTETLSIIR